MPISEQGARGRHFGLHEVQEPQPEMKEKYHAEASESRVQACLCVSRERKVFM